jgi:hypothetical protein
MENAHVEIDSDVEGPVFIDVALLPRKSSSRFSRDSPSFSVIHVFFPVPRSTKLSVRHALYAFGLWLTEILVQMASRPGRPPLVQDRFHAVGS